jgi:serine/threonine-protein kinase
MTTWPGVGSPGGKIPLRELIKWHGALSAESALLVLRDSLLGLAAAWEHGTVHQDYRPETVLVGRDGSSELTGFGGPALAEGPVPDPEASAQAPELLDGAPPSPASNLYAATAVFFECLTGSAPSAARIRQFRRRQVAAAVLLGPAFAPLCDLMAWGMAANPARRPASASAFTTALDDLVFALYGPEWNERGRRDLAERVADMLKDGSSAAADAGGTWRGAWLGGGGRALYAGVAAVAVLVVLGVAGGALALSGHFGPATASAASGVRAGSAPGAVPGSATSGSSTMATSARSGGQPGASGQTGGAGKTAVTAEATVTPPAATSACARAATFTVSGTISSTTAGAVTYQWVYSAGTAGPVQTAKFSGPATQRVTGTSVRSQTGGTGWAAIKLLGPAKALSNKATYTLDCSASPVTVSASAAVAPAQAAVSCGAVAPAGTFTGTIQNAAAGTVRYYWEMPTGNGAAQSLNFAAPGTEPVTPVRFTDSSDSAAESATLVVVSPAAVSSNTATFTVSCTPPAAGQPELAVQLSTNQTTPRTGSCGSPLPTFRQLARVKSDKTVQAETYHWIRPDGTATAPGTVSLNAGTTATLSDRFTPPAARFSGAETLVFTRPARGRWSIPLTLSCSGATVTGTPTPTATASVPATAPASPSPLTVKWTPTGGGGEEAGTQGVPFSTTFTAAGGAGPYAWTAAGLPPGLTINSATGTISGTPTTAGGYSLLVTVTDGESPAQSASAAASFDIRYPAVHIAAAALPDATAGVAYPGVQFSASGGDGTYSWFVAPGTALPAGLSLSPAGVLSGTPATAGTFTVYVSVTDAEPGGAGFATTKLTLTVGPAQ